MAERRMIHKKISLSESLDCVSGLAQLFFTWSIPHTDDLGFLPRSPRKLKGMVFPLKELKHEQMDKILAELIEAGMYTDCKRAGYELLHVCNFEAHQTLRRDLQPFTYFEMELGDNKKENWEKALRLRDKILSDTATETPRKRADTATRPEEKRREEKEEKRSNDSSAKSTATEEKIKDDQDEKRTKATVNDFIRFFHTACKRIRRVEPVIDGGKDGKLIKNRLTKLEGDISRLERMTIWYLTRKKKVQDNKGVWHDQFKNPPAIATMLSTSFFNQLLSEERNALTYMQENLEWVEKIYSNTDSRVYQARFIGDEVKALSDRFSM